MQSEHLSETGLFVDETALSWRLKVFNVTGWLRTSILILQEYKAPEECCASPMKSAGGDSAMISSLTCFALASRLSLSFLPSEE